MGTYKIEKQKKQGKSRTMFIKSDLPENKESFEYKAMVEFLNEFHLTTEEYLKHLQDCSETSTVTTNEIELSDSMTQSN